MIAGYRLEVLLESGGRSETYRARHIRSGQSCFIKILAADESLQFLLEAKIAAQLFHPNVADVYETGTLKTGEPYVVSEMAGGQTLRDLLDNVGVPSLMTTIQVARQTAEALHAVHLKGLTHRAVNPENITLTTDAEHRLLVKIHNFDFGGVNERSIVSNKFLMESALDSIKYFAPEQIDGGSVGPRTDVYGLGVVFYEMLAGVPPFDASTAAALVEKQRNHVPPEIKISNFELRMLLTHTLTEALRKQPQMRLNSANFFARQVRHIELLATHVSTPPPAGSVPNPPPPAAVGTFPPKTVELAPQKPIAELESETVNTFESETGPVKGQSAESETTLAAGRVPTLEVDGESIAVLKTEIEAVQAFKPVTTAGVLSAVEQAAGSSFEEAITEDVVKERIRPVRCRSRLKLTTRRFSRTSEPLVAEMPEDKPLANAAPQEVEPVQIQPEQTEVTVVPAEPEKIAVRPAPAAMAKIEWEQPEDDIPSAEEVLEIQRQEQRVEPNGAQPADPSDSQDENFLPEEVRLPGQNRWADVIAAATRSPYIEPAAAMRKPEAVHKESIRAITAGVENGQLTIKVEGESTDAAFRHEPFSALSGEGKPVPGIDRESSGEDLTGLPDLPIAGPMIDRRIEVQKAAPAQKVDPLPREKSENKTLPTATRPEIVPVLVQAQPKKLTVVPMRSKQMETETKRQATSVPGERILSSTSDAVGFYPTILGHTDKRKTIDRDRKGSIFSDRYGPSGGRYYADFRAAIISGGVLVGLIVFIAVGAVFLGDDVRSASRTKPVVATSNPAPRPRPQTGQATAVSPVQPEAPEIPDAPLPEIDGADVNRVKPLAVRLRAPISRVSSQTSAAKPDAQDPQNEMPKAAAGSRMIEKMAPVSSTLVISYDNGKSRSKTGPSIDSADKTPPSISNKTPNPTRPRIVKDPRP